jgi:ABC-type transport system involved in cytochrome c biogenesis permease component
MQQSSSIMYRFLPGVGFSRFLRYGSVIASANAHNLHTGLAVLLPPLAALLPLLPCVAVGRLCSILCRPLLPATTVGTAVVAAAAVLNTSGGTVLETPLTPILVFTSVSLDNDSNSAGSESDSILLCWPCAGTAAAAAVANTAAFRPPATVDNGRAGDAVVLLLAVLTELLYALPLC